MTTEQNTDDLERIVLETARQLAEYQNSELKNDRKANEARAKMASIDPLLEEAEIELLEVDVAYGQAKLAAIRAVTAAKEFSRDHSADHKAMEKARRDLWRIANSGDEEQILKAARKYAEMSVTFHEQCEAIHRLGEKKVAAETAAKEASERRKLAVQKRGKLKAEREAIGKEYMEARMNYQSHHLFEFEQALTKAACALNHSQAKQYAYSYVYTQDLFGTQEPSED